MMKALFLALQSFQDIVADHRVTAMCDSLWSKTGQLLRWTESHNVHLEARYLPGQSNVLADLSRWNQVLGTEWSLHPQVARKLIHTWGSLSLDLFATHLNAKLALYCSLIPDPQVVFEDAFRHPWKGLCSVGLEQSSTQPTTGPLVLTLKQLDPLLAGWIYA